MNTVTTRFMTADLAPLEIPGPIAHVPSLDRLYELTSIPDRRVVFRGVDWAFYEELVDAIPERSNIHVDYDGRDLEIMSTGRKHGKRNKLLGQFVEAVAQVLSIPYSSLADTTWKRPEIARVSRPTNVTTFSLRSSRLMPSRWSATRMISPTILIPIWRSRSTSPGPRSTARGSMPHSVLRRSGDSMARLSRLNVSRRRESMRL